MKQYRIRSFHQHNTVWSEWRNINIPFHDVDVLTVQFNEPLTVKEAEEFFKHFVEKL